VLRTLQGCLLASAIGAVGFLFPYLAAVCLASLLVGLADGPAGFAASRELHRTAPPRARRLLFALSSMGGSFGSLTSAILVAFVVALTDWRTAILVTVLLTVLATVPLRLLAGAPHGGAPDIPSHPTEGYARAMALMAGDAGLRRLVIGATLLAMSQGAWLTFFIAYVVDTLELSLPRAAALLAVTQALALGSRLAFSRWADHIGSARPVFVLICVFAMVSWLGLASLERGDGFTLPHVVVATAGISIAAWNGLTGAELASRVPDSALVAVNGVTAISMTVGYAIAVAGLAWLAQHMGGYAVPFLIIAVALALNAVNFALLPRSSDS
jgi:predicted MFS family arabinose efflux permease